MSLKPKKYIAVILIGFFIWSMPLQAFGATPKPSGGIWRYPVTQAEADLQNAFPQIEFKFSPQVNDWYKVLLLKTLRVLDKNQVAFLNSIALNALNLNRRGLTSFRLDIRTRKSETSLSVNPEEFPLETGFKCGDVADCLKKTSADVNREFIAVLLHELGHSVDFGGGTQGDPKSGFNQQFKNGSFSFFNDDPSVVGFYPLCFTSETKLGAKKCGRDDFVSDYAKTNAFEDFAETMAVYVLDGPNFYKKASRKDGTESPLMKKYIFFRDMIFGGREFQEPGTRTFNLFSTADSTLRRFSLKAFLERP